MRQFLFFVNNNKKKITNASKLRIPSKEKSLVFELSRNKSLGTLDLSSLFL